MYSIMKDVRALIRVRFPQREVLEKQPFRIDKVIHY